MQNNSGQHATNRFKRDKSKKIDLSAADVNDLFKGDVEYAAVVNRGK
jgi:hypothetical protein